MGVLNPDLSSVLAEEINSFGQFCLLLDEEREALARLDQDALDHLISRKQMLCEHLSRIAEQRQALAPDPAAVPDIAADWQRLLALAARARDLNRVNGAVIEARLQHNHQAMALLQLGEQVSTYSADGLSRTSGGARHLGKA